MIWLFPCQSDFYSSLCINKVVGYECMSNMIEGSQLRLHEDSLPPYRIVPYCISSPPRKTASPVLPRLQVATETLNFLPHGGVSTVFPIEVRFALGFTYLVSVVSSQTYARVSHHRNRYVDDPHS